MLSGVTPWPAALAERYRRDGHWPRHSLAELSRAPAAREPDRIALVAGGRTLGYRDLDRRADRIAGGLVRSGARAGDRWVVQLPNGIELVALLVAMFRCGVVPVLALPAHRQTEIEYLCEHTGAGALVVPDVLHGFDHRDMARRVQRAVPGLRRVVVAGAAEGLESLAALDAEPTGTCDPDPEDVAFCLLSGGTTGRPKLIPRTHTDYVHQIRGTAEAMGLGEQGAYLAALPMAHNAALGCPGVLGALWQGATVVLAGSPAPDEVFPLIAEHGVTLTTLMPAFLSLWEQTVDLFDVDLSRVVIEVGGARLEEADARRAEARLGATLTRWFGMGEGLLCFSRLDDPEGERLGTEGWPLSAADELRVVDGSGRAVPAGGVGELLTQGPGTLRGYYRAPEYNAHAFTPEGWLRTGDLVRLTAQGRLVVVGRLKDVVNRAGEKVPAGEVEDHLRAHPAVADVAVVALPDAVMGERTCAAVVPRREPPTLADLRALLSDRGLAGYKLPDQLEIVDCLPYTPVGKVDKGVLRERLAAPAEAHPPGTRGRPPVGAG